MVVDGHTDLDLAFTCSQQLLQVAHGGGEDVLSTDNAYNLQADAKCVKSLPDAFGTIVKEIKIFTS